jgi:hypothetical protein
MWGRTLNIAETLALFRTPEFLRAGMAARARALEAICGKVGASFFSVRLGSNPPKLAKDQGGSVSARLAAVRAVGFHEGVGRARSASR